MAEPLKATFFALQPRDRMVLLPATLVFIAIIVALVGAFVALNWGTLLHFRDLIPQSNSATISEEESLRMLGGMFGLLGWIFIFLFPIYIAIAAYEAACLRWMIRGETPGLFGITIDNDTWRVWGVYWAWFLANFVISIAMSILIIPIMFMTMGDIMQNPTPEAMSDWQMRVQLPITLLQYIPLIFLGIRLGPAAATSVGLQRFAFFTAWTVTRDRFWSLLGAYAIWAVVFGVLFAASFAYSIQVQFDGDWDAYWRLVTHPATDPEEVRALFDRVFSPAGLTAMAVSAGCSLVLWLLWALIAFGINARAVLAALEEGNIEKAAS